SRAHALCLLAALHVRGENARAPWCVRAGRARSAGAGRQHLSARVHAERATRGSFAAARGDARESESDLLVVRRRAARAGGIVGSSDRAGAPPLGNERVARAANRRAGTGRGASSFWPAARVRGRPSSL